MFDYLSASLKDVVEALASGSLTSEQLVNAYITRISDNNVSGLGLRAVIEVAPYAQAIETARKLDDERRSGRLRSPIHGIPILVKDMLATSPELGMQTTAGSLALVGSIVPGNAQVVQKLVDAGAIIIGKSAMTVFSNFFGLHNPPGWSPRNGQTLSAYRKGGEVGGSSTGSAVGLTAGFCAASIGSETRGSIISPAFRSAVYGLKPTVGLVSTAGAIGISSTLDCIGPMGKSAWDVAAMLSQMAISHHDYTIYTTPPHSLPSNYRLGVVRRDFLPDSDPNSPWAVTFDHAIKKLSDAGMIHADPADIEDVETLWKNVGQHGWRNDQWIGVPGDLIDLVEAYDLLNDYLGQLKETKIHTFEELHHWNLHHPELAFHPTPSEYPQGWMDYALDMKSDTSHPAYRAAIDHFGGIAKNVEETFQKCSVDVLVFPPIGWVSEVAASGGFPIATIPVGLLESNDPVGIMFIAPKGGEGTLIGLMAACESVFPPRPLPTLLAGK